MSIPTEPNLTPAQRELAALIDHTLLKPEATRAEVERLCAEAKAYGFASVCVNTFWVPLCAGLLKGTAVKVCTVVGFPLGAMDSRSKAFETREAVARGAQEVDMVINVGAIKSEDWATVESDVRGVVEAAGGVPVKVILETGLLTDDEKVRACKACVAAGAAFVKTSTGFSKGGATEADIALMRATVGAGLGVKASGGVRTLEDARKMVAAGASRIGASSGIAIVTGGVGSGY